MNVKLYGLRIAFINSTTPSTAYAVALHAFIASGIDYIVLKGISLFAVSNKLDNSKNWSIDKK